MQCYRFLVWVGCSNNHRIAYTRMSPKCVITNSPQTKSLCNLNYMRVLCREFTIDFSFRGSQIHNLFCHMKNVQLLIVLSMNGKDAWHWHSSSNFSLYVMSVFFANPIGWTTFFFFFWGLYWDRCIWFLQVFGFKNRFFAIVLISNIIVLLD